MVNQADANTFLTRDPTAAVGALCYAGLFSSIGVLFWCSAAAICLFGTGILFSQPTNKEPATIILCSGLFTTVLLLDDLFLLHSVRIKSGRYTIPFQASTWMLEKRMYQEVQS
jgi:hypothetical protein